MAFDEALAGRIRRRGFIIILSDGFWKERFGGASNIVGTRLTLGGRSRTIVGVMPRGFQFPDREARVWVAMRPPSVIQSVSRTAFGRSVTMTFSRHNGLARLKPGVTPDQAIDLLIQKVAVS